MAKVSIAKAGWTGNYFESLTAATTLSASDSGKVYLLTAASAIYTITLPTASAAISLAVIALAAI